MTLWHQQSDGWFVDAGWKATELGQCPHAPGTREWRFWQKQYASGQINDRRRHREAERVAQERIAAVCGGRPYDSGGPR